MLMMSIRTATTRLNVRSLSSAAVPTTPSKSFDEKREFKDGPGLGDFIAGVVPRDATWKTYEGRLKLDRGEKGRLRLPPWLKTEIPMGKNFAKIKAEM
jgi:lipoic acid synthetase